MEKAPDFQNDQHVPPAANAPSYEEAMKCSTVPLDEMITYPNLVEMQSDVSSQPPITMQQPLQQMIPLTTQMPSYIQTVSLPAVCSSCAMPLRTRVDYTTTCSTHCACLLCCIFGLVLCAPCVYCTKCCREPRLKCANCNAPI